MASFAERQLAKFGWEKGKGLGKNEDGIEKAIVPSVKNDSLGLGKQTTDWSSTWWDHVFNKTAMSIKIETDNDGQVKVKTLNEDEEKKKKKKEALYGRFVKSGNEKEEDFSRKLTDEELLRICEGRTGAKGATADMTGKLRRVEGESVAMSEDSSSVTLVDDEKASRKRKKTEESEKEDKKEKKRRKEERRLRKEEKRKRKEEKAMKKAAKEEKRRKKQEKKENRKGRNE